MPKSDIKGNVKSRWDARFLVNTVMGLLSEHPNPSGDVVLSFVTATLRGYCKGYFGRISRAKEEGTYQAVKDYARERVNHGGKDARRMEEFLITLQEAEAEARGTGTESEGTYKKFSAFPLDCLSSEEEASFPEYALTNFRARFYSTDGEPRKGMLVFEDDDGVVEFATWMNGAHPELLYQELDEDDWEIDMSS